MAGDGLTDEEAVEFWKRAKLNFGSRFPQAVKEVCEIALLGGALLLASRLTESTILLGLYWTLLASFALKIAAQVAFPTAYDSPSLPILLGLALTAGLTVAEHYAIKSAADAALLQMQGDKAVRLLESRARRSAEAARLASEYAKAGCSNDELVAFGKVNMEICRRLQAQRQANAGSGLP